MKIKNQKLPIAGMLVCLLVVLAWFSPWWLLGKNLAPLDVLNQMMQPWRGTNEHVTAKNHIVSDAVDQYLPYRMVAADSYSKEGWLGWSSLTYGGTAQYANTMALYYDWTMQLHRWFDFWTAWHLGIMGQVMLAAVGMQLFLRGRSISQLWATCGALTYAANSQFITWIYHRWTLGAFCWVPWILWAIDGFRKGRSSFWGLVPFFMAMAFLGGTLQHAAYVMLVIFAVWAEQASRIGRSPSIQLRLLGNYTAWVLLGLGMAAMMFLPCGDAFVTSTKLGLHMGMHGSAEMGVYPKGLMEPLANLAAYPLQWFPSILGRCETIDLLKIFKSELFYIAYFGSLPVLIAYICIFRRQTPMLARLLMAIGLLLPLTPLLRLLYQRLLLLYILGGIIAFVHFMEHASSEIRKRLAAIGGALAGIGMTVWFAISVLIKYNADRVHAFLYHKIVEPSAGSSFGYFREWMQTRADRFMGDLFIWSPQQAVPLALFLAGLAGLRMTAGKCAKLRKRGSTVVACVVILEVSLFGARWITYVDPAKAPLFANTPETEALRTNVGAGKVATMMEMSGSHMAMTPFIPNTLSPYGIPTIHGYDSIMPNGMLLVSNHTSDPVILGRMGVTHLITYPGNPDVSAAWKEIWNSPSMTLYENPTPVPRYIGFGSGSMKEAFFKPGIQSNWVELEETSHLENTRRIEVPPGIHWLRIAENQDTGWEYRLKEGVSQKWSAVQRATDASMLLNLGNSDDSKPAVVEMRYNPPMRTTGFTISGIALILTLAGGIMMAKGQFCYRKDLPTSA
ncbi:MAG: hypothetical protein ABI162_20030 [Luteolibacter sp.]